MSQIGFMMFSLGVSGYGGEAGLGYTASMFHLFTHAMFKALLFLCAGVVIHHVHNNDMRAMGGLRKAMPVTHAAFLIACLAISGIPPFAGFFSKEEILLASFESNKLIYAIALFTSALTAFYMFRLYFSIFWRKENAVHADTHHGEANWLMLAPLLILSVGAIAAGFVPFGLLVSSDGAPLRSAFHLAFSAAPVALAALAIITAMRLYKNQSSAPSAIARALGLFYRGAYRKFYVDEVYLFITKRVVFNYIARPSAWIDRNVVDGTVNLSASVTSDTSELIRTSQGGRLQTYVVGFFAALIILLIIFMIWWR
jgi:NADH-quinone oxidoreductase subunit L